MILVRPIFWVFDESGPDGILQNVIPLFTRARVASQTVLEKSFLPDDLFFPGNPSLPLFHRVGHAALIFKGKESMNVVGHREKKFTVPISPGISLLDRFAEEDPHFVGRELVAPAFFAANRDEEAGIRVIHPERHLMPKPFPVGEGSIIHRPGSLEFESTRRKRMMVGTV
jgi:hypothetical protein